MIEISKMILFPTILELAISFLTNSGLLPANGTFVINFLVFNYDVIPRAKSIYIEFPNAFCSKLQMIMRHL